MFRKINEDTFQGIDVGIYFDDYIIVDNTGPEHGKMMTTFLELKNIISDSTLISYSTR